MTRSVVPTKKVTLAEKASSAGKNDVAEITQLDMVEAMIAERGLTYKFEKLPPAVDFTFQTSKQVPLLWYYDLEANQHASLLFLGQNPNHETWAVMKYWPDSKKTTEVIFLNCPTDAPATEVKTLDEMSLMYPMKIFKHIGTIQSLRHLKYFV